MCRLPSLQRLAPSGVPFGPDDVGSEVMWRRPTPYKAAHSVRLLLTAVTGELASQTVEVTVPRRPRPTGAPRGSLSDGVAPPPPPQMATWKKARAHVHACMHDMCICGYTIDAYA